MNPRILGIIGGLALVVALLSPFILGSSQKVEQLFEAAETLYEQNDYEGAIAKYKAALKESKKLRAKTKAINEDFTTFVNFKVAMSYVKLAEQSDDPNYYEKALEHVEKADQTVKLAEYEEQLIYLWGYILYKTGQLEQAVEKLTQLIENFPNSSFVEKAEETIAEINKQLQDLEEETAEAVVSISIIPPWINDLSKFEAFKKKKNRSLIVPNCLRAEKRYEKAAKQYETFANTNTSTKEAVYALYWAGWCYHEAASDDKILFSKSLDAFQRLIDNHNDSPYIRNAKEKAKFVSERSITQAEEAVYRVKQPDCKSDLVLKAIRYLGAAKQEQERGKYKQAYRLANDTQEVAKKALDNHETARRYVDQGYTYLNQGQLETSVTKAREALRIDPCYQNAKKLLDKIKQKYFDQGVNYVKAEEYAKAIRPLKKAIAIASCKEAYCHLGRAHLKLGEFKHAIAAAEKALAIDPNYECAKDIKDSIDIGEN